MKYLLTALLLYTTQNAYANRAVMEALPTTFNAVTIGTTTPQLLVNTTFYGGVIPTVSIKAASNVVVGADKCVIYSTGSMGCTGAITGPNVPTSSGPFVLKSGDTMTGALAVTGTSVTANAFFGDGSNLSGVEKPVYFISSNTVTGSTATVKNVVTVFSTYSYTSNTMTVGSRILFECIFRNESVSPGTPVVGLYLDGTAVATGSQTGALADLIVRAEITLTQTGRMVYIATLLIQQSGSTSVWANATPPGTMEQVFDETASHTFNCSGSRGTGGAVDFMWMRVAIQ